MRQAAKFLLVCLLMVSIGAQWAVLQGVAWVGMAVTYSLQDGSLAEGLSKTFDGEHPCPLCKAVKKGVEDEQGPAQEGKVGKGGKKAEYFLTDRVRVFPPTVKRLAVEVMAEWALSRTEVPNLRPPKRLA